MPCPDQLLRKLLIACQWPMCDVCNVRMQDFTQAELLMDLRCVNLTQV